MSFLLSKKKRHKFDVELVLEELQAVPYLNSYLFAKLKLLDGGKFHAESSSKAVNKWAVTWKTTFRFQCKMTSNISDGTLDTCRLHISIKKEVKGGKSCQRLGYKDINLAAYANTGRHTLYFHLDNHDGNKGSDNPVLHISLELRVLEGDICFKVPNSRTVTYEETNRTTLVPRLSSGRISPSKSGLPYHITDPSILDIMHARDKEFLPCHSRNSSLTSQVSGYSSTHHSRQGSSGSAHIRNLSSGSGAEMGINSPIISKHLEIKRKSLMNPNNLEALDLTRANPDKTIEELMAATNLEEETSESGDSGLNLEQISFNSMNTPVVDCILQSPSFS